MTEPLAEKLAYWRTRGRAFGTGRHRGESRTIPTRSELDGQPNGWDVEHWDGRRDCTVTPRTINLNAGLEAP